MKSSKSIHSPKYAAMLRLLLEARDRAGVTQIEMAKRLSVTQSAVSKVERGERRLDVVELHDWCGALGISFAKFSESLDRAMRRAE